MTNCEFQCLVNYLANKGVKFVVKFDPQTNTESIPFLKVTKKGKFYRANGVIISKIFAKYFI
jgi:hypothetical protein